MNDNCFDHENRLIRIERGDGDSDPALVAVFEYDALGRRIEKYDAIADAECFYYYNAQWQVLAEENGSSVIVNQYVFGNYIDETLLMNDGTDDYYYAHNHLFSTAALLEDDGTIAERCEYSAYGTVSILTSDYLSLTASQ